MSRARRRRKRRIGWGGRLLRLLGLLLLVLLALLLALRVAAWVRERDDRLPPGVQLIPTPLGRVAAQVSGPPEGPPILLVHGTAAWSGFWSGVSRHLAARGWRVIAIDLPPFGYSDRDPQARYDRRSQAVRLSAVLRAAAKRPAVVVGHSFGAGAATELALQSPRQIRRLVLVDAALGKLNPPAGEQGAPASLLGVRLIAEPLTSASVTNPAATGVLLRSMIARKAAADPWLTVLRQPMRRSGTTSAYAAWLPALFVKDDGGVSRRTGNLETIAAPVALIWGAADSVTPLADGERLAGLTRARSFIRLPGVGHIPHIEDEAGFLAALDASIAPDAPPPGGKK
jgi:pimeloyl-ACP methyl ester carboxylesterase